MQLDREVFALKQTAKMTENLHRTSSRQDLEQIFEERYHSETVLLNGKVSEFSTKNQELAQEKIRLEILLSNGERHLQDKEAELLRC